MTPEVSQCTRFQSKATSKYNILNIVNSTINTRYVTISYMQYQAPFLCIHLFSK